MLGRRGLADFSGCYVSPCGQRGGFDRLGHQRKGAQNVRKLGLRQAVQVGNEAVEFSAQALALAGIGGTVAAAAEADGFC